MATFLDFTGLEQFSKIFVFILVLLGLYAAITMSKAFGDNKWIAWLIAFVVAIFVILSDLLSGMIRFITPWFAVLFIFVMFITVASKIFGAAPADYAQFKMPLLAIVVIIFIVGAAVYLRQNMNTNTDTVDEDGNPVEVKYTSSNIIFHPQVLGAIFLLLVAIFTVALLAGKA